MDDTTPEMAEKMREMMRQKTPIERWEMGSSMFDASQELVTRFILEENPGISAAELKQELFLKFYKDDFSPAEREKILKHFENVSDEKFNSLVR
jgi:hypothetical protein